MWLTGISDCCFWSPECPPEAQSRICGRKHSNRTRWDRVIRYATFWSLKRISHVTQRPEMDISSRSKEVQEIGEVPSNWTLWGMELSEDGCQMDSGCISEQQQPNKSHFSVLADHRRLQWLATVGLDIESGQKMTGGNTDDDLQLTDTSRPTR